MTDSPGHVGVEAVPTRLRRWIAPALDAAGNASLRGVTLASKLALTLAVARLLGPEELGQFGLAVSAVALTVFALGFEYHYFTIRKLIALSLADRAAMVRDQIVLHLLTLGATLPLAIWLALNPEVDVLPSRVVLWYLALVPVELVANELGIVLVALERPVLSNVVLFLRTAGWVYVVVPLIAWQADRRHGLDWLFGAWWSGAAISIAFAVFAMRDLDWAAAWPRQVDWQRLRHGLRVALPFVATSGASLSMLFLDRFFIEHHLGLAAVGIYTFFASLTTGMHTLIYSSVSLLRMPRLVVAHQNAAPHQFRRELRVMGLLTLGAIAAMAIVLMLVIQPLLSLAGRDVYGDSLPVFYVLLTAAACRAIADVPVYALYARHLDGYLAAVNVAGLIVSVSANLVLIPRIGLIGAAAAALMGALTLLALATLRSVGVLGLARVVPH